jgi:hypothetical protein
MVPITYGVTGLLFGLTAESGVIVISVDRTAESRVKEVLDNLGNIVGVGHYAFKADYKVSATWLNTGVGLSIASVGNTVSLANQYNTNGVSGGHTIVHRANLRLNQEDFVKFELDATQYPAI